MPPGACQKAWHACTVADADHLFPQISRANRIRKIRSVFLSLAAGARMLFPGWILTDVLIDPFIFAPFTFGQKFSAAYIRTIIASGQCNN